MMILIAWWHFSDFFNFIFSASVLFCLRWFISADFGLAAGQRCCYPSPFAVSQGRQHGVFGAFIARFLVHTSSNDTEFVGHGWKKGTETEGGHVGERKGGQFDDRPRQHPSARS